MQYALQQYQRGPKQKLSIYNSLSRFVVTHFTPNQNVFAQKFCSKNKGNQQNPVSTVILLGPPAGRVTNNLSYQNNWSLNPKNARLNFYTLK